MPRVILLAPLIVFSRSYHLTAFPKLPLLRLTCILHPYSLLKIRKHISDWIATAINLDSISNFSIYKNLSLLTKPYASYLHHHHLSSFVILSLIFLILQISEPSSWKSTISTSLICLCRISHICLNFHCPGIDSISFFILLGY